MDYHHHARLTVYSREQLAKSVLQGELTLNSAAAAMAKRWSGASTKGLGTAG
jgi:hypothetical protein